MAFGEYSFVLSRNVTAFIIIKISQYYSGTFKLAAVTLESEVVMNKIRGLTSDSSNKKNTLLPAKPGALNFFCL